MWLVVDPSPGRAVRLTLSDATGGAVADRLVTASGRSHVDLLRAVVRMSRQRQVPLPKLEGIAVVNGVGSFTALRLAIAFANTLAWIYRTPVSSRPTSTAFRSGRPTFNRRLTGFLRPQYSSAPNITKPARHFKV